MKNKLISIGLLLLYGGGIVLASHDPASQLKKTIGILKARTEILEKRVNALQGTKRTSRTAIPESNLLIEMYAHGPAVVTSPALGVRRSAENGQDLMINLPSINDGLELIRKRQEMDNYAIDHGIAIPERPIIALSGQVIGQAEYVANKSFTNLQVNTSSPKIYTASYPDNTTNTNLALSAAELNVVGEAGPWATASIVTKYDADTSGVKINRAFVTLGQLNKLPFYFTLGQVFVPFGSYSSFMITDPSTKVLGKAKDKAAILGFYKDGFQAQAYVFDGLYGDVSGCSALEHMGFNLAYEYADGKFSTKIGGSVTGSFAESDGFEKAFTADKTKLQRRIPGIDGNIKIEYKPFVFRAEYLSALNKFDTNDLTFNNQGARPSALHIEGAMQFDVCGKNSLFAVGYEQTWQALALQLPKSTIFATYSVAIVKNAMLGFEYRYDKDYAADAITSIAKNNVSSLTSFNGTNKHKNQATVSLSLYF